MGYPKTDSSITTSSPGATSSILMPNICTAVTPGLTWNRGSRLSSLERITSSRPSSVSLDASVENEIAKEGDTAASSVEVGWQAASTNAGSKKSALIDLPHYVCQS